MKESLPNEFCSQRDNEQAIMEKYAFFDEEKDVGNFQILRQVVAAADHHKNFQTTDHRRVLDDAPSYQDSEMHHNYIKTVQSPRLPDLDIDDDIEAMDTCKLDFLNFKRPPTTT